MSTSKPDRPDAGDDGSRLSAALANLTTEELEQELERVSELFRSDLRELGGLLSLASPALSAAVPAVPASRAPETARVGGASRGRSRRRLFVVAALAAALVTFALVLLINQVTRTVPPVNPPVQSVSTAMIVGGAGPTADAQATTAMPGQAAGGGGSAAESPVAPTATLAGGAASPSLAPLTPRPTVPLVEVLRRRVAVAEGALATGQLQATFDYGNGAQATSSIQFDLGTAGRPAALHIVNLYQGTTGSQRAEYLLIGDRLWRRTGDGPWVSSAAQEGILDQVGALLPGLAGVLLLDPSSEANSGILRWYDPARDGDATLQVEPTTGIPQQFRLVSNANGAILTVSYRDWNLPQVITAPPAP